MDKNLQKIEEEIRQYKLYKIQTTEAKIREYQDIFSQIKENIVIKFTKNSISSIFWILLSLISIGLIIISISFIFPEFAISMMEKSGKIISQENRKVMITIFPYIGYFIFGLGLLFGIITSLLKKNNRKRNVVFKLAKLLDEIIDYMGDNVKDEKKKYEYFVENIASINNRKN